MAVEGPFHRRFSLDLALVTAEQRTAKSELTQWVRLAQNGDSQAFEQVFHRTQGLAKKIAYSIVGTPQVEDAVQESYLLAFRKLKQLREPEAFIGWLSRLVLHTSQRMAQKTKPNLELDEERAKVESPTERVVDSVALRQALARLPQKDRDVLILREFLQLSYDEVAYALKVPTGTVRSRLNSARKKLAACLKL